MVFEPWFSVLKKKIGDTEYGVGWLPLGGYVKISGMIDESLDKEQMKKPAEPWEFRAKPTWQRLIIMLGGVTVNFLLGIFIYSMTLYFYGDKYLPNSGVTDGVICSDFAKDVGFKNGDKIVSVDGENIERFFDINQNMVLRDKAFSVIVEREGGRNEIFIGENFIKHWKNSGKKVLLSPAHVGVVGGFSENSNAERAGLLKDDVLFAVEGVKTKYLSDFKTEIQKHKNKTVKVDVLRNNVLYSFPVEVSQKGLIGIMTMSNLNFSVENYSFFASFPAGYNLAMNKLGSYISQFALIFNSENDLAGELGGFGAIGSMFPSTWDWLSFWNLTAFLSLMLAFMNLLPIPALDGGHVLFLLYEMIVGKPAPEKVLEYAQTIGMILLLSLLVYANGNDIIKLF